MFNSFEDRESFDIVDIGDEWLEDLLALEDVQQNPTHHPEGDALYHVLQVFEIAHKESDDPDLWAVALFHDIGKSISIPQHAEIGAEQLSLDLNERITWLVRHHMDLLYQPKRTRRMWVHTPQLAELETIRRWDLAGRSPYAHTMAPETAIEILLQQPSIFRGHSAKKGYA